MKRGDHICIKTMTFTHHGIYCGNGHAIHFDGHTKMIRKDTLEIFSNYRSEHISIIRSSDSPEIVIQRAETQLRNANQKYDLTTNNCEHFATYCAIGKWVSKQVDSFTEASEIVGDVGLLPVTSTAKLATIGYDSIVKRQVSLPTVNAVLQSALRATPQLLKSVPPQVAPIVAVAVVPVLATLGVVSGIGFLVKAVGSAISGGQKRDREP